MTAAALRHNFSIIVAQRIIGMEYLVASVQAIPWCLAPFITQLVVVGSVTTGTILKGKRLDLLGETDVR